MPVSAESPVDEYERRLAERRGTVRAALTGLIWVSAWLHLFGLVAAGVANFGRDEELWVVVLVLWAAATLLAALSVFVCVRNVRHLTADLVLLGAAPWLALAAELTGFAVLVVFGVIRP